MDFAAGNPRFRQIGLAGLTASRILRNAIPRLLRVPTQA